jgi:glycosyltransferase involved in cell wall biosynthesis
LSNLSVSVVVPAYNAGQWIEATVKAALAQTRPPDEIVVVNDASTDETSTKCRELARRSSRVPIVYHEHESRRGGGATRNTGVAVARGDWIFNLDADDLIPPELLESLVAAASVAGEDAVVHTEFAQFFRDERRKRLGVPITRRRVLHRWRYEADGRTSFLARPQSPANAGNRLFSRATFDDAGGYFDDTGPYDAWTFGLGCYALGRPFVAVPQTAYLHRLHSDSYWMSNERAEANRRYLHNAVSHFPDLYPAPIRDLVRPDNPEYPEEPFSAMERALSEA